MKKAEVIKMLNSRLGVANLEKALVEIDSIINYCLRFWSEHNISGTKTTNIEIVNKISNAYTFDDLDAPDYVDKVFDKDIHQYVEGWDYCKPILSDIYPGTFIIFSRSSAAKLSDFETEPDLPAELNDLFFAEYCEAIHAVLNLGQLNIELSIDTQAIIENGRSKGEAAKDIIREHTDPTD
tara:strand:- start:618 stop:1160 length:543 start_codon:yes stop_codon:yes gene_type:complete